MSEYPNVPLPDFKQLLADLQPIPGASRVVIGAWQEPPYRKAIYLIPDQERLQAAKDVPNGSANAVEYSVRCGSGISRDHLIEGHRVLRFLPDLRAGAPVSNVRDILVHQPQHYSAKELAAFLHKIGSSNARVTVLGYEPVLVAGEEPCQGSQSC